MSIMKMAQFNIFIKLFVCLKVTIISMEVPVSVPLCDSVYNVIRWSLCEVKRDLLYLLYICSDIIS